MNKNKIWRLAIMTAALTLVGALAGCERTNISDINKHPERYAGDEITIAGRVTSNAAPTNPGTFQIDDGTGRLWVLSSSYDVPAQGTQIAVTGLIEPGVRLGSTTLATTLQEIKRYGGS
jgi:hypothetical protein